MYKITTKRYIAPRGQVASTSWTVSGSAPPKRPREESNEQVGEAQASEALPATRSVDVEVILSPEVEPDRSRSKVTYRNIPETVRLSEVQARIQRDFGSRYGQVNVDFRLGSTTGPIVPFLNLRLESLRRGGFNNVIAVVRSEGSVGESGVGESSAAPAASSAIGSRALSAALPAAAAGSGSESDRRILTDNTEAVQSRITSQRMSLIYDFSTRAVRTNQTIIHIITPLADGTVSRWDIPIPIIPEADRGRQLNTIRDAVLYEINRRARTDLEDVANARQPQSDEVDSAILKAVRDFRSRISVQAFLNGRPITDNILDSLAVEDFNNVILQSRREGATTDIDILVFIPFEEVDFDFTQSQA